jgi:hypothetical protein
VDNFVYNFGSGKTKIVPTYADLPIKEELWNPSHSLVDWHVDKMWITFGILLLHIYKYTLMQILRKDP